MTSRFLVPSCSTEATSSWLHHAVATASVLVSLPSVCHACSGPGAGELIGQNIVLSQVLFVAGLAASIHLAIRARKHPLRARWMWMLGVLAIFHPMWWVSALQGDCGYTLCALSILVGAIQALVVARGHWVIHRGLVGPKNSEDSSSGRL
jgi:hypothetical protein